MFSIPSSKSRAITIPAELRESLSCLDIVWSDMFETGDINPEEAKKCEADFLKGAPLQWLNLVEEENLPLVKRDGFNDLMQLIKRKNRKSCLITDVSLQYQSGSGGSTLAMQVLWRLRKDFRCARVVNSDLDTKELSKQVVDLFLLSNEEQAKQDRKTVLLLLDTKKKMDNNIREDLIEEIHKRGINTETPTVIILNCRTADFTLTDTLILKPKLSEEEINTIREKLLQQIRLQRKSQRKVTTINLLHHEASVGSALAREVLSNLSEEFTCETLTEPFKSDIAENKVEFAREIENTGNALLSKYETHQNTVLLMLDNNGEKPLRYLLKSLLIKLKRADQTDHPAFIIINAYMKNVVRVPSDVKLKMELLPEEKEWFAQKKLQLESKHMKIPMNFHAFKIMQGGFKKEDAKKVIEAMIKHVTNHKESHSTRLLHFLALINSYVPGSHLSKVLCEQFIAQTEQPTDEENPTLETIMKPYMDLIVIFSEGDQKGNCIRLAHPMIADACLEMLTEHNVTRFDIALDFLNSLVKGEESNYEQICKSMFITRPEGLMEKEKFSKLIIDIMDKSGNNTEQCIFLLKLASDLFSEDPFYPQALARFYYITVKEDNKFVEAEQWAKMAIERDPQNSHIRDTLGQIHKNHLRKIWIEAGLPSTDIENILDIAQSAIDAFKAVEEAAENESDDDTVFNNRGLFGFLQVCKIIHPKIPLELCDQQYSDFINGLRGDVNSRYDFFEWYLAFSRLSLNKEEPDYFHEDVEECYSKYFKQGEQTDEMTLNEKKIKSFGGLIYFLKSDINVLKEHQSALKSAQSDNENILYILANILLSQPGEPCEKN